MNWFNHDQGDWYATPILGEKFYNLSNLKILSGLEIDRAMIKGDHGLIINSNDH